MAGTTELRPLTVLKGATPTLLGAVPSYRMRSCVPSDDGISVAGADDMFMRGFGADLNDALPGLASRRNMSDTSAFINR